jgi:hypothetical protein
MCECGDSDELPDGYFMIHPDCFHELSDLKDDIESTKKRLERGESTEEISRFIKRMEKFDKRWEGTQQILKEIGLRR